MKRSKRIFWSVVLQCLPFGAGKIANIIRKHHLYGSVGTGCKIQKRKIPLYSELIFLHNNICIGSNVSFSTHDASHIVLNSLIGKNEIIERIGCIEIMDNVFIGAGVRILSNVRIGSNVIIAGGSVVTRDIPDNTVYSGNPAKLVCSIEDYMDMLKDYSSTFKSLYGVEKILGVDKDLAMKLYHNFLIEKEKKRKNK